MPSPRWLNVLSVPNEEARMLQKIVSIGCMISSAVASPIFFELQTTRIWIIDILIFFVGSACFMLQNQEEIEQHGPYALAAYTCFGLGAYSSTRTTLSELVPWIPTSLCIILLLTVFLPPKIRELRANPDFNDIHMEEGMMPGILRSQAQPGSVQSDGSIQQREQTLMTRLWLQNRDHDVAFTLGRPASRYSNRSVHDSTIILSDSDDQPSGEEHIIIPQQPETDTRANTHVLPKTIRLSQQVGDAESETYPRSISPASWSERSEARLLL